MADATMQFAPIARRRSRLLSELELTPGRYVVATVHREANTRAERLARIVEGLNGLTEPVVFPIHPRTSVALERDGLALHDNVLQLPPLGYLDFAALAAQARVIVTDSGGLQKEAYWYGVPCVTLRPSTEWVDTVSAGANRLVDDDPAALAKAVAEARMPQERPQLYGDGKASTRIADLLSTLFSSMIERTETPAPASTPSKTWDVAIVGAGYVGVPLACTFATAGRSVLLVDVLPKVVDALNRGESHIEDVPSDLLAPLVADGRLAATTDYDALRGADAILIALPTPLSKQREPDLSIVLAATQEIAKRLHEGQLVVLESTTYPGTTREKLLPILESTGLKAGEDFNLAFSPERVDPGSPWDVKEVPKVVGGITEECSRRAAELYGAAIGTVHTVSSPEAAELTKLLENIFRSVNIALVNELAQLCDRMGIDVWEVVDAAATKPFGFMSFKPGPGLGGHCIPIDPFYLTWKAREFGFTTEFIELAGKVNEAMPYYCRSLISQALNHKKQKSMSGSQILVLGVAYKPDIGDVRESPALKLIELLRNAGANVAYHDPHVPSVPGLGLESVPLEPARYDCVTIVTDHSSIDYSALVDQADLVVDLRNATGEKGRDSDKVWKL